jgi:hypothetical protein
LTSLSERIADPDYPLRSLLQAAKAWRVPPTVFLGDRTVRTAEWDYPQDTQYALALEDYEANCDDRGHYLPETTKPEHDDAYRPDRNGQQTCYKCRAEELLGEVLGKEAERGARTSGLMIPLVLDADVVALNRLPVPPLPPELQGQ